MRLNAVLLKKKVKFLLLCYQSWINFLSLVNINQRDAQILVKIFIFSLNGSTCLGLSLVHHQEQNLISCTAQLVHAGTSGYCIQQPDVPACTALYSLINVAPDDGLMIVRNM